MSTQRDAQALMRMSAEAFKGFTNEELYAIAVGLREFARNKEAVGMYPEAIGEIVDIFGFELTAMMIDFYLRARERYASKD